MDYLFSEIRIYNFNSKNIGTFSADKEGEYGSLINYNFQHSLNSFGGNFSFTYKTTDDSIIDTFSPLDVVYILEKGKCVFIGIITNVSFNAIASTLSKTVTISGKSAEYLYQFLTITLNVTALNFTNSSINKTVTNINDTLSSNNEKGISIKDMIESKFELFIEVASGKAVNLANTKILQIIKQLSVPFTSKYYSSSINDVSSFFEIPSSLKLDFPISSNIFEDDVVNFYDYIRGLLPSNIYEIFSKVTSDGCLKLCIRECPFDGEVWGYEEGVKKKVPGDWKNLNYNPIKEKLLTDYTLTKSIDEVYNVFYSYIEGSKFVPEFYANMQAIQDNKSGVGYPFIIKEKQSLYGYKPLRCNFRGFNTLLATKTNDQAEILEELNKRIAGWYGYLDEMYNATISIVKPLTDNSDKDYEYPAIGERVLFLGGEFYVNGIQHSWRYGNPVKITLNCERGGEYDRLGNFSPLKKVTKKLRELTH